MKFSELQRLQRMEGITVLSADERIEQLEARLRTITKERDALRAKVAEMERQVPICRAEDLKHAESLLPTLGLKPENPLYALPGAKGETKW